MALLHISEPGQAPDPHQRRLAVGIDLGTTHSLVAAMRHGVAECLPDAQGRNILPSAVRYLEGGRRQIGFDARAVQADDPENTIVSVKRFMGRRLADITGAGKLPYRFVDRPGMVALATRDGDKSPVEGKGLLAWRESVFLVEVQLVLGVAEQHEQMFVVQHEIRPFVETGQLGESVFQFPRQPSGFDIAGCGQTTQSNQM